MEVFVSWAGRESQAIALILRDWLPRVLHNVTPWVSAEDILKGTRWDEALWDRLQATSYAIICATADAVRSPWVNFEAGVVARAVGVESHVSPVLFGMSPSALGGLPLGRFQCTVFTQVDVERLLKAINAAGGTLIPESEVVQRFRGSWASLRDAVEGIEPASRARADPDSELEQFKALAPRIRAAREMFYSNEPGSGLRFISLCVELEVHLSVLRISCPAEPETVNEGDPWLRFLERLAGRGRSGLLGSRLWKRQERRDCGFVVREAA